MTENKDELLVRKFFEENASELPDDGFSRRVMRRLPDRAQRLNRIWTAVCAVVGLLLAVATDLFGTLMAHAQELFAWLMAYPVVREYPVLLLYPLFFIIFLGGYKLISEER